MGHQAQAGGGDGGQNHGDQGSQHADILRHLHRPVAVPSRVAPVTASRQLNGLRHTAADGADHRTLNHLTQTPDIRAHNEGALKQDKGLVWAFSVIVKSS